jgi:hypothetical protein
MIENIAYGALALTAIIVFWWLSWLTGYPMIPAFALLPIS